MEYVLVEIIIPIFTILASILIGIYTVQERIKNENKEEHKPYLVLRNMSKVDKVLYKYYLNIYGINKDNNEEIFISCIIGNIGYGVASNIKFYDLNTSKQAYGNQLKDQEHDQKLYTTFDIACNNEKHIDMLCNYSNNKETYQDESILLCVYQDLNQNFYDFIISINYKANGHFDYSAFQRTSKSYKNIKNKYKKNYNTIIKEYKNL